MWTYVWAIIRQRSKSFIFWLILFVILIGAIFEAQTIDEQRSFRSFIGHDIGNLTSIKTELSNLIDEADAKRYPEAANSFAYYLNLQDEIRTAAREGDTQETLRLNSLILLTRERAGLEAKSEVQRLLLRNRYYELWKLLEPEVDYDAIRFYPMNTLRNYSYDRLAIDYSVWLYTRSIEPVYSDELKGVNIVYAYVYKLLPIILLCVPFMLTFSSINTDLHSGTLKMLLSNALTRRSYYLSKWMGHVLIVLLIIALPLVIMTSYFSSINGFGDLRYPLTVLSEPLTRVEPIPNYLEDVTTDVTFAKFSRFHIGHVAPLVPTANADLFPHPEVTIVSFGTYMLMVMVLVVLFVSFSVAFIQLISSVIDDVKISFVVSAGISLGATILSLPLTRRVSYNVSPFTQLNPARIIEGTYCSTFLTSSIILVLMTSLLLVVGQMTFDRKAI